MSTASGEADVEPAVGVRETRSPSRATTVVVADSKIAGPFSSWAEKFDGDAALQTRLSRFLGTCYGAAVQAWEAETPPAQRDALTVDTPAASALQKYYATLAFPDANGQTVRCASRWQDLRGDLAAYARSHITPATDWVNASLAWLSRTYGSDEWVINNALRNYRQSVEPPGGGQLDPSSPSRDWWDPVAWLQGGASFVLGTIAGLWNPVVMGQIVEFFQRSAYVFYGYTMMVAYAAFPLMLAFALWPGQFGRFAAYLMLLLSLKMWPVFWAMIGTAHEKILSRSSSRAARSMDRAAPAIRRSCSSSPR